MKSSKRILSVALCLFMVIAMIPVQMFAADAIVSFTVDNTECKPGDVITVVISNKEATLKVLGLYLEFDKELLECTSVLSVDDDDAFGLYYPGKKGDAFAEADVVDTLDHPVNGDTINNDGIFSFGVLGSADGTAWYEGKVATLTFVAKAGGTAIFKLVENTDVNKDVVVGTKSVTITVPHTCNFNQQKTTEDYLKSEATCVAKALYYYSCECGAKGTETFESGEKNLANHATGCTLGDWVTDASGHKKVWSSCGADANVGDHTGGEATCKDKAICGTCGVAYGSLNASNHKGETEIRDKVIPSCNTPGYTGDTYCKDCGTKIASGEPVDATGNHVDADEKWESNENQHYHTCGCGTEFDKENHFGGEATCVAKAVCDVCKVAYGSVNASNHKGETEIRDKVIPSCNTPGYTGDTYCKDCGTKIASGEPVDATGNHVDADEKWESNENQHYHTCGCGTEFDKENHFGGEATCVAKAVCDVCKVAYGSVNASNHKGETELVNVKVANCNETGYTGDIKCKDCGQIKEYGTTTEKDMTNHVQGGSSEIFSDETGHWGKCAVGHVIDKVAHSGGSATCTTTGKCATCEYEYIPALGHNYSTLWTADATNHWHVCANNCGIHDGVEAHDFQAIAEAAYLKSEANCSSKAIYYKSCSVCKVAGTETFESGEKDATAHDFVDGVCSHNDKHVQFDKEPGAKVEDVIEGLVSADITVKQMVEGTLTNVADLTTLFKDGAISVAEGKLTYELLPAAPEGEYYVEIGEYVVMIVVEKADTDYDRPSRPTLSNDAVKKVITMIDELPSAKKVTLDDEEDIEAARKAYDALSKANQAKVTNYEDLVEVEEALKALLATPEMPEINNPFVDVADDVYYTDAVLWAVENNITSGTGADTFSPNAICTRAQVVTFLWRAAGSPAPKSTEMPFTDVEAGAYYAAAVQWAVENNITGGTSATTFDPNGECTRGQIVTFLWRAEGYPAAAAVNAFADVAADAYYNAPVLWAVANGITNGTSATTFSPADSCTRAQVVTFLYRAMAK